MAKANPRYGNGVFRRRIRLCAADGLVTVELEDGNHGFRLRLRHDGSVVRGVEADTIRHPFGTCPEAVVPLREFVGHRLADGSKALPASADEQAAIAGFMAQFAATQPNPDFFTVLDSARRIAGTGSLGLARFVILVEGKGSPDGNVLLDLKEARASALAGPLEQLGIAQPSWESEARRVVVAQQRLQAVDHAFLVPVAFDGRSWVLRGLQPSEDRVAIAARGKHLDRLREVGSTMGAIVAWDQLRAAGRGGAAGADPLLAFAEDDRWVPPVLEIAAAMARTTASQWEAFRQAHL